MADLPELYQQLAFLQGGGGQETSLDKINKIFGTVNTGIGNVYAVKKMQQEAILNALKAKEAQAKIDKSRKVFPMEVPASPEEISAQMPAYSKAMAAYQAEKQSRDEARQKLINRSANVAPSGPPDINVPSQQYGQPAPNIMPGPNLPGVAPAPAIPEQNFQELGLGNQPEPMAPSRTKTQMLSPEEYAKITTAKAAETKAAQQKKPDLAVGGGHMTHEAAMEIAPEIVGRYGDIPWDEVKERYKNQRTNVMANIRSMTGEQTSGFLGTLRALQNLDDMESILKKEDVGTGPTQIKYTSTPGSDRYIAAMGTDSERQFKKALIDYQANYLTGATGAQRGMKEIQYLLPATVDPNLERNKLLADIQDSKRRGIRTLKGMVDFAKTRGFNVGDFASEYPEYFSQVKSASKNENTDVTGSHSTGSFPKIGETRTGNGGIKYRFKGGNPANQNNWIKVSQ